MKIKKFNESIIGDFVSEVDICFSEFTDLISMEIEDEYVCIYVDIPSFYRNEKSPYSTHPADGKGKIEEFVKKSREIHEIYENLNVSYKRLKYSHPDVIIDIDKYIEEIRNGKILSYIIVNIFPSEEVYLRVEEGNG